MSKKIKRISLRLGEATNYLVEKYAAEDNRNVSDWVRLLILKEIDCRNIDVTIKPKTIK